MALGDLADSARPGFGHLASTGGYLLTTQGTVDLFRTEIVMADE
jgi:hypothetical protein